MNSPVTTALSCRRSIASVLMPGTKLVRNCKPRVRPGSASQRSSSGVGSPAEPGT